MIRHFVLIALVAVPSLARAEDRASFAKKLAGAKGGMAEKDARALLGEPDEIRKPSDPNVLPKPGDPRMRITTTRTREVWCYGQKAPGEFPVLGTVSIDDDGKVQYVSGGLGTPPDPKLLPEAELAELLRTIDRAPAIQGWHFDPARLIEVVNALQPLGKDKALAALAEFLRVASDLYESEARDGVFLVLRALFEVPADPGYMPRMNIGATENEPTDDAGKKKLPRFPLEVIDDVPILLVNGYSLGGVPQPPEEHVRWFRENATLRAKPLAPTPRPLDVIRKVAGVSDDQGRMIAEELLRLVREAAKIETKLDGEQWHPDFEKAREAVSKLKLEWSAKDHRYVRGS